MLPAEGQACPQSISLVTFEMCFQSVMCRIGTVAMTAQPSNSLRGLGKPF